MRIMIDATANCMRSRISKFKIQLHGTVCHVALAVTDGRLFA